MEIIAPLQPLAYSTWKPSKWWNRHRKHQRGLKRSDLIVRAHIGSTTGTLHSMSSTGVALVSETGKKFVAPSRDRRDRIGNMDCGFAFNCQQPTSGPDTPSRPSVRPSVPRGERMLDPGLLIFGSGHGANQMANSRVVPPLFLFFTPHPQNPFHPLEVVVMSPTAAEATAAAHLPTPKGQFSSVSLTIFRFSRVLGGEGGFNPSACRTERGNGGPGYPWYGFNR